MATNFPGSLDSGTEQPSPSATTEMDDSGFEHDVVHTNHSGAIIALETKVGTGDSNAVADSVLAGTGSGTSGWTTGTLANSISGNAATATALATARTIGGVSFNGTANIDLPGVNTAGNQATSGNAATASKWSAATTLTLAGDATGSVVFDGSDTTETLTVVVANDSHTHGDSTINGLNASAVTAGTFANARIPTTMTGKVSIESDKFEADKNGSASAPAFTWDSDPSMGLYRKAGDCLGIGLNGETGLIVTESTNNNSGSVGNGYVGINTYCGGWSGGTAAFLTSTTIEGVATKRIGFDASSRDVKSWISDWALSDEAFMALQPVSFSPNGGYVLDGEHFILGTDEDKNPEQPPVGALPIRRAGLIQEDVAEIDLHLISQTAIDWQAISTAMLGKVQRLMERVAALEAE